MQMDAGSDGQSKTKWCLLLLPTDWIAFICLLLRALAMSRLTVTTDVPESRGWAIGPIHFQCLTLFHEGLAASFQDSWAHDQRSYD